MLLLLCYYFYDIGIDKGKHTMSEQVKTLWLLECMEGKIGRLFTLYAKDEQEAENQVKEQLLLHPELSRVSLSERPDGFTFFHFRRPGHIVCKG